MGESFEDDADHPDNQGRYTVHELERDCVLRASCRHCHSTIRLRISLGERALTRPARYAQIMSRPRCVRVAFVGVLSRAVDVLRLSGSN